jgi:hypothetical protein
MEPTMTKQTQNPTAAADAAHYNVVSPLEHDGTLYSIGSDVVLTEQQAAPLLGHTVVPAATEA